MLARQRCRGISMYLIIVFVALGVIAIVGWVLVEYQLRDLQQEVSQLEEQRKQYVAQKDAINTQLKELAALAGWPELWTDPDKLAQELRDFGLSRAEAYGLTAAGGEGAEVADLWVSDLQRVGSLAYLELVLAEALLRGATLRARQMEIQVDGGTAPDGEEVPGVLTVFQQIKDRKAELKSRKEAELREERNRRSQLNTTYQPRIQRLGEVIQQLETDVLDLPTLNRDREREERGIISQLEVQIKRLQTQEAVSREIIEEHGKIISSHPSLNMVFLNVGEKDSALRGIKFQVYTLAENGARVWKGATEIAEVFDTFSQATVIQLVDPTQPLIEGDRITNPLFSRERAKRIALLGSVFQVPGLRLEAGALVDRLSRLGVDVVEKVDIRTDFVIAGAGYDEDDPRYQSALKNRVPIVEFSSVAEYVRY